MGAERIYHGRDEALAIMRRPLPEIEAMLADLRLPKALLHVAQGGGGTSLDHGWFAFGRVYFVRKDLKANRKGALAKGDTMRFLGGYVFPYDNGLRLYFEPVEKPGDHFCLEFEGNFPNADGVVRMIDDTNRYAYFTQGADIDPARRAALSGAETTLLQAAARTDALVTQAYDDAKPAYIRALEAMPNLSRAADGYVRGGDGIETNHLDHGPLRYGQPYRVIQSLTANREGALTEGQTLIFQGAQLRFGQELTLFFTHEDGTPTAVTFYPSDPAGYPPLADLTRYLQAVSPDTVPAAHPFIQARAVLEDLRQQREATL